jgi:hypothetical protein
MFQAHTPWIQELLFWRERLECHESIRYWRQIIDEKGITELFRLQDNRTLALIWNSWRHNNMNNVLIDTLALKVTLTRQKNNAYGLEWKSHVADLLFERWYDRCTAPTCFMYMSHISRKYPSWKCLDCHKHNPRGNKKNQGRLSSYVELPSESYCTLSCLSVRSSKQRDFCFTLFVIRIFHEQCILGKGSFLKVSYVLRRCVIFSGFEYFV